MVPLQTKRLIIREFTEEDFRGVHKYASNPNVVKYMPWGPNTESDSRNFIQRKLQEQIVKPRKVHDLAITLKGEVIGGGGLTIHDSESGSAELGYCLEESHWGKGIGTEFAAEMIRYGFEEFGFHRVYARCDAQNTGSFRVMEKNGMIREGLLRDDTKIRGVYRSTLIYSILRHEWDKRQA